MPWSPGPVDRNCRPGPAGGDLPGGSWWSGTCLPNRSLTSTSVCKTDLICTLHHCGGSMLCLWVVQLSMIKDKCVWKWTLSSRRAWLSWQKRIIVHGLTNLVPMWPVWLGSPSALLNFSRLVLVQPVSLLAMCMGESYEEPEALRQDVVWRNTVWGVVGEPRCLYSPGLTAIIC